MFILLCAAVTLRASKDRSIPWHPTACAAAAGISEQIMGPADQEDWRSWLQNMTTWRKEQRLLVEFSPTTSAFSNPQLQWTQRAYIIPQMHPFDLKFYNPATHQFTVAEYLADVSSRYGTIDGLLLWTGYPNLGVDDRNQFDWFRSIPGGTDALQRVVSELRAHNVATMLPYNPWDIGTHREDVNDAASVALMLNATGAVGINGDTMVNIPQSFYDTALRFGVNMALQPEIGGTIQSANYTTMGWGYWSFEVLCIDTMKWLFGRRMTNVCDRWAKNRSPQLLFAFFSGDGYVPWENVWGTWNGVTPRDGALIARTAAILRYFGSATVGLIQSESWEPYFPCILNGTAASRWKRENESVIFFVNTASSAAGVVWGPAVTMPVPPAGCSFIDCYRGKRVPVSNISVDPTGLNLTVTLAVENSGIGCLFVTRRSLRDLHLATFLKEMRNLTTQPLSAFSATWQMEQQSMEPMDFTPLRNISCGLRMAAIPPNPSFFFVSNGTEIEGPPDYGVDFQFFWESYPSRHHSQTLSMPPLCVDTFLATNADWLKYVQESGYIPADKANYLRFWLNSTTYPPSAANQPVTWVSVGEAAGFCHFYGKRLPHAYEWQHAAQGNDGRNYPWGNDASVPGAYPQQTTGTTMPHPPDVDAFPSGASPYGVEGMVGIVWQWTDTFRDNHTRANLVRGGAYYRPSGSGWYYRSTVQVNLHNKYLLMDDSFDRAGTIGFRCVADVQRQWPTLR